MSKFCEIVWDGNNLNIPKEMGTPQEHHFLSTNLDNLIELCGRICYDSISLKKSRSSPDYHKHIAEVGHLSVQEHANFTVLIPRKAFDSSESEINFLKSVLNRPGIYLRETEDGYRLTLNIRCASDWCRHNKVNNSAFSEWLGGQLRAIASELCPLALFDSEKQNEKIIELVTPETDEELWVSFHIRKISRSVTHELVRHGDFTGISQRSTRYVDEHDSAWDWHPLIELWENNGGDSSALKNSELIAKEAYKVCLVKLEEFIKSRGVDRFTARKQARGAARGVLGNALSTELIFSASLSQWKWMLKLRASDPADAEIRIMFVEVFNYLKEKFPDRFVGWGLAPASDGMGEIVTES